MNKTRKNRVSYLLVLALTLFSLILSTAFNTVAFQAPGDARTVRPKIINPGTGGGGSSDDWDAAVPLNCRDSSAFRDCYRSLSRYCPGTLERDGGPDACYSNAWDQCFRVYCQ